MLINTDWCLLMLIDAFWYWLICWLMLIDAQIRFNRVFFCRSVHPELLRSFFLSLFVYLYLYQYLIENWLEVCKGSAVYKINCVLNGTSTNTIVFLFLFLFVFVFVTIFDRKLTFHWSEVCKSIAVYKTNCVHNGTSTVPDRE